MKIWLLPLLPLPVACDYLPRDPGETSTAVAREKRIRVGMTVLPDAAGRAGAARLLARLSRETSARAQIRMGAGEPLLQALARGDLDLVIAPFDVKTPWATMVALSPPLSVQGRDGRRIEVRAAMRNGENRWIMRVETAARAVADPGADN